MKTLIIYSSVHHGNTEKIGKTIAETVNADIIKVQNLNTKDLNSYDLIGFGSGIYMSKFHDSIIKYIENMPPLCNKRAFVFSTSGMGKVLYNNPLEEKLKEKGLKIVGSFACKGFDTFGPFKLVGGIAKGRPDEEDIKKAREFAVTLNNIK